MNANLISKPVYSMMSLACMLVILVIGSYSSLNVKPFAFLCFTIIFVYGILEALGVL